MDQLDALIRDIGRSQTVNGLELPFIAFGVDAFDRLNRSIKSAVDATARINSLYVMFCVARETCPHRFKDLLEASTEALTSQDDRVRNYAVTIALRTADISAHGLVANVAASQLVRLRTILRSLSLDNWNAGVREMVHAFLDGGLTLANTFSKYIVGTRIADDGTVHYFGLDEINHALASGGQVTSIERGEVLLGSTDGAKPDAVVDLAGFTFVVNVDERK